MTDRENAHFQFNSTTNDGRLLNPNLDMLKSITGLDLSSDEDERRVKGELLPDRNSCLNARIRRIRKGRSASPANTLADAVLSSMAADFRKATRLSGGSSSNRRARRSSCPGKLRSEVELTASPTIGRRQSRVSHGNGETSIRRVADMMTSCDYRSETAIDVIMASASNFEESEWKRGDDVCDDDVTAMMFNDDDQSIISTSTPRSTSGSSEASKTSVSVHESSGDRWSKLKNFASHLITDIPGDDDVIISGGDVTTSGKKEEDVSEQISRITFNPDTAPSQEVPRRQRRYRKSIKSLASILLNQVKSQSSVVTASEDEHNTSAEDGGETQQLQNQMILIDEPILMAREAAKITSQSTADVYEGLSACSCGYIAPSPTRLEQLDPFQHKKILKLVHHDSTDLPDRISVIASPPPGSSQDNICPRCNGRESFMRDVNPIIRLQRRDTLLERFDELEFDSSFGDCTSKDGDESVDDSKGNLNDINMAIDEIYSKKILPINNSCDTSSSSDHTIHHYGDDISVQVAHKSPANTAEDESSLVHQSSSSSSSSNQMEETWSFAHKSYISTKRISLSISSRSSSSASSSSDREKKSFKIEVTRRKPSEENNDDEHEENKRDEEKTVERFDRIKSVEKILEDEEIFDDVVGSESGDDSVTDSLDGSSVDHHQELEIGNSSADHQHVIQQFGEDDNELNEARIKSSSSSNGETEENHFAISTFSSQEDDVQNVGIKEEEAKSRTSSSSSSSNKSGGRYNRERSADSSRSHSQDESNVGEAQNKDRSSTNSSSSNDDHQGSDGSITTTSSASITQYNFVDDDDEIADVRQKEEDSTTTTTSSSTSSGSVNEYTFVTDDDENEKDLGSETTSVSKDHNIESSSQTSRESSKDILATQNSVNDERIIDGSTKSSSRTSSLNDEEREAETKEVDKNYSISSPSEENIKSSSSRSTSQDNNDEDVPEITQYNNDEYVPEITQECNDDTITTSSSSDGMDEDALKSSFYENQMEADLELNLQVQNESSISTASKTSHVDEHREISDESLNYSFEKEEHFQEGEKFESENISSSRNANEANNEASIEGEDQLRNLTQEHQHSDELTEGRRVSASSSSVNDSENNTEAIKKEENGRSNSPSSDRSDKQISVNEDQRSNSSCSSDRSDTQIPVNEDERSNSSSSDRSDKQISVDEDQRSNSSSSSHRSDKQISVDEDQRSNSSCSSDRSDKQISVNEDQRSNSSSSHRSDKQISVDEDQRSNSSSSSHRSDKQISVNEDQRSNSPSSSHRSDKQISVNEDQRSNSSSSHRSDKQISVNEDQRSNSSSEEGDYEDAQEEQYQEVERYPRFTVIEREAKSEEDTKSTSSSTIRRSSDNNSVKIGDKELESGRREDCNSSSSASSHTEMPEKESNDLISNQDISSMKGSDGRSTSNSAKSSSSSTTSSLNVDEEPPETKEEDKNYSISSSSERIIKSRSSSQETNDKDVPIITKEFNEDTSTKGSSSCRSSSQDAECCDNIEEDESDTHHHPSSISLLLEPNEDDLDANLQQEASVRSSSTSGSSLDEQEENSDQQQHEQITTTKSTISTSSSTSENGESNNKEIISDISRHSSQAEEDRRVEDEVIKSHEDRSSSSSDEDLFQDAQEEDSTSTKSSSRDSVTREPDSVKLKEETSSTMESISRNDCEVAINKEVSEASTSSTSGNSSVSSTSSTDEQGFDGEDIEVYGKEDMEEDESNQHVDNREDCTTTDSIKSKHGSSSSPDTEVGGNVEEDTSSSPHKTSTVSTAEGREREVSTTIDGMNRDNSQQQDGIHSSSTPQEDTEKMKLSQDEVVKSSTCDMMQQEEDKSSKYEQDIIEDNCQKQQSIEEQTDSKTSSSSSSSSCENGGERPLHSEEYENDRSKVEDLGDMLAQVDEDLQYRSPLESETLQEEATSETNIIEDSDEQQDERREENKSSSSESSHDRKSLHSGDEEIGGAVISLTSGSASHDENTEARNPFKSEKEPSGGKEEDESSIFSTPREESSSTSQVDGRSSSSPSSPDDELHSSNEKEDGGIPRSRSSSDSSSSVGENVEVENDEEASQEDATSAATMFVSSEEDDKSSNHEENNIKETLDEQFKTDRKSSSSSSSSNSSDDDEKTSQKSHDDVIADSLNTSLDRDDEEHNDDVISSSSSSSTIENYEQATNNSTYVNDVIKPNLMTEADTDSLNSLSSFHEHERRINDMYDDDVTTRQPQPRQQFSFERSTSGESTTPTSSTATTPRSVTPLPPSIEAMFQSSDDDVTTTANDDVRRAEARIREFSSKSSAPQQPTTEARKRRSGSLSEQFSESSLRSLRRHGNRKMERTMTVPTIVITCEDGDSPLLNTPVDSLTPRDDVTGGLIESYCFEDEEFRPTTPDNEDFFLPPLEIVDDASSPGVNNEKEIADTNGDENTKEQNQYKYEKQQDEKQEMSADDDTSEWTCSDSETDEMSRDDKSRENPRSGSKVRALEEVVSLLKKHVRQREAEIENLGKQLKGSSDRIKTLEKRLDDKAPDRESCASTDKETLIDRLKELEDEREDIEAKIVKSKREREDAEKATRRAKSDLDMERHKTAETKNSENKRTAESKQQELPPVVTSSSTSSSTSDRRSSTSSHQDVARETNSETAKPSSTPRQRPRIMAVVRDQQILDLSLDNTIMREKLDRMHEISAENLLLQSDVADYHAELSELRNEAKDLRGKCYELIEDNRICKAEVRDLRRYIDLQKANKTGDTRQDLVNKIEYYQMEHDRLLDEVRRLKHRLGDLSPRRSRDSSPRSRQISPRDVIGHKTIAVRFDDSAERGSGSGSRARSPVCDAIAASTASAHAASRLTKDRGVSLSPSAILNIRDLTMERYKNHLNRPDSPTSVASDNTEILLKTRLSNGAANDERSDATPSDEDEIIESADATLERKIEERHHRSSSRCRSPASYRNGFRSLSPRMTSTQNDVKDTARDRYPTLLKRSLPRRAFAPRSPADLRLGYAIKFTRPGGKLSRGTVRYIGHLPTRTEIFIGVELDGSDGKHTGTFQGNKYFACPLNKGIFTPFSKVIMAWE